MRVAARVVVCALGVAVSTATQQPDLFAQQIADEHATEDMVIEEFVTSVRFDADGTGSRWVSARVRIQSEVAVQTLGQLAFAYNAAEEELRLEYVRVTTKDGRVLEADSSGMRDMAAPISLEAPIYTDQRNLHVAVPGLRPGVILEYRFVADRTSPIARGEYWFEHKFISNAVVLSERLELELPAEAQVAWSVLDPDDRTEAGRRILVWDRTQLEPPTVEEMFAAEDAFAADVRVSSFGDWQEVADWYDVLQRDRLTLDPSLRAKATELTDGLADGLPQIEAIYKFVAAEIRYVSLSFGLGAYQPHAAAEVLANGYGDCKDKHTLLAALLAAVGYEAHPVLVNSFREVTLAMPSPGQFDHLISTVVTEEGLLWLDTTSELAPMGFLTANLRGERGLAVRADGAGELLDIPAELPFPARTAVSFEGEVDDEGSLTGTMRLLFRGDVELIIRLAMRRVPANQRAVVASSIAATQGLPGTADGLSFTPLEATERPFELWFDLSAPEYLNRALAAVTVQLPMTSAQLPSSEGVEGEFELGGPFQWQGSATLALPVGVSARPPPDVWIEQEFATYRSTYRFEGNTLTATRVLNLTAAAVPAASLADYEAFRQVIETDEQLRVPLTQTSGSLVRLDSTRRLDADSGTDIEALLTLAEEAGLLGDWQRASRHIERVLELDPSTTGAKAQLAYAYMQLGRLEEAEALAREQVASGEAVPATRLILGNLLLRQQRYAEATEVFRSYLDLRPLDAYGRSGLGAALVYSGEVEEGLRLIEEASRTLPNEPTIRAQLGLAYASDGRYEEAIGPLRDASAADPNDRRLIAELAAALVLLERRAEAIPLLERVLAMGHPNPRGFEVFGRAVYEVCGQEGGTNYLGELAIREPVNPQFVGAYAWLLAYTAQYDKALLWAREATRLDPDNGRFWALTGRMALYANYADEALAAYEKTMSLSPEAFSEDREDRRNYEQLKNPSAGSKRLSG